MIKEEDKVKVEYTGKLKSGEVFDSSKEGEPLEFTVGSGRIIPGFDRAVRGMKINEEKEIVIDSSDAYGPKKEELVQELPRDSFPEDFEPEEGSRINLQSKDGRTFSARVVEAGEEKVSVDLNHPLAGKDLIFNIKVLEVN